MKILSIFLLLIGSSHTIIYAQVGIVKSKTGNTVYCNAEDLHFTLNTDKYIIRNPKWENSNRLTILENHISLEYFEASQIQKDINSTMDPLGIYQKWETDYIKSSIPNSVKMSEFKTDNLGISSKEFKINTWYYCTYFDKSMKSYSYFVDIYKSGYFIRIHYQMCNDLEMIRSRMKSLVNQLKFDNNFISIDK